MHATAENSVQKLMPASGLSTLSTLGCCGMARAHMHNIASHAPRMYLRTNHVADISIHLLALCEHFLLTPCAKNCPTELLAAGKSSKACLHAGSSGQ